MVCTIGADYFFAVFFFGAAFFAVFFVAFLAAFFGAAFFATFFTVFFATFFGAAFFAVFLTAFFFVAIFFVMRVLVNKVRPHDLLDVKEQTKMRRCLLTTIITCKK